MSDSTNLPKYVLPSAYTDSNFIEAESQMVDVIQRDSRIDGRINPATYNRDDMYLSGLSSSLSDMYTILSNSKSLDNKLQKQNEVINVIDKEQQRLHNKQQNIDLAYIGKQRSIHLNESYRLKQNQYIKLTFVVILTISAFIFISVLSNLFPYIPSSIFDVLSIIVVSSGLITFYYLYVDMLARSNTDYNELQLGPPVIGNTIVGNVQYNNALLDFENLLEKGLKVCFEGDCCAPGKTEWDANSGYCVPIKENFTVNQVINNSPFEYSNYSPI